MKDNRKIEEWLSSYEIAQPKEEQIKACIKKSQEVFKVQTVRRADSLWFFMETQMKFMKREILFSFCLSVGLLFALRLFQSLWKMECLSDVSVGIAPFLVVPIIRSIAKSRQNGIMELETSAKFGLGKIITARTIFNQGLAICMIFLIWLGNSVFMEAFVLNRLLFSFISFEIAAICFLWFGTSSVIVGICSAAGWTIWTWILLGWEDIAFLLWNVNSLVLGCMTMFLCVVSMLTLYRYVKNLSFESEDARWNFE